MPTDINKPLRRCFIAAVLVLCSAAASHSSGAPAAFDPASLKIIGTVDDRFQSYNVEMVEVTGGRFWKPYKDINALLNAPAPAPPTKDSGAIPAGMNPNLYQQRPPIDLTNPRLRKLAAALGPAYVRVSGTWANSTYFHNSGQPAPQTPPKGFGSVLSRAQWNGVVDFAKAVDAKLVTSFATSQGTRDAAGVWTPDQARQFLDYTKSIGGSIAAAEFMNEPTLAVIGGAPKGYDAAAFARDMAVFRPFVKQVAPGMLILGPGGVMEGTALPPGPFTATMVKSEDILKATGPVFDGFSFHLYRGASKRCGSMSSALQTTPDAALTEHFLARGDQIEQFYADLRDKYEPGKPLWLTETADSACGGNPWASTFLDSFRYLDQLGRLAKRGLQVHMHNTLAASDYGLLDDATLMPRPNYWAALMWRRFMGRTVLDAGPSPASNVHLYAHCMRDQPGGVALLAINLDRGTSQSMQLATAAQRFTLTARNLEDTTVQMNGTDLKLGRGDTIPQLKANATPAGNVTFAPASITFLTMPNANNASCR